MPTISFSPYWIRSALGYSFTSGTISKTFTRFSSNSNHGRLRLMKGTVPTDFSGLNDGTDRQSDILWDIQVAHNHWTHPSTKVVSLTTAFAAASASGTASWFWYFCSTQTDGLGDIDQANGNGQFIGTVSAAGGGGDLILPDVTITSGKNYKIQDLAVSMAEDFTY